MARPVPITAALLLNWRRPDLTVRCLDDLLATGQPGLAVLVIDNGSGDDSAAQLRAAVAAATARGHRVEALLLADNLGFAGGMNRGFEWAHSIGAEFALVLNNDLRLPADFLAPLVRSMADDPRLAAVAPTIVDENGRVWAQGGSCGFWPNTLRLNGHGGAPAPREHGPENVDFVPGACVLARVAAVRDVGGFDEGYFMYWEDVDLCRRLARRGGRIVWLPWVRVTHLGGASAGGGRSPLRKYFMARNCLRFLRRYGTFAQWAALALFEVLLLPLLLLRSPRLGWAKLCGLAAGLHGRPAGPADVDRWRAGPAGG